MTTMYILNERGHDTAVFGDSAEGLQDAERRFEQLTDQGYVPFAGDGLNSDLVRMDGWVPGFDVVYWVRPLAGG